MKHNDRDVKAVCEFSFRISSERNLMKDGTDMTLLLYTLRSTVYLYFEMYRSLELKLCVLTISPICQFENQIVIRYKTFLN